MAEVDTYTKLNTKDMDRLFTELFELKAQKKILDDKIKAIEAIYKPDLKGLNHNLYYELDNGKKFSIKLSERKGTIDTDAIEEACDIYIDDYRKKPTTVYTLRVDDEG